MQVGNLLPGRVAGAIYSYNCDGRYFPIHDAGIRVSYTMAILSSFDKEKSSPKVYFRTGSIRSQSLLRSTCTPVAGCFPRMFSACWSSVRLGGELVVRRLCEDINLRERG